MQTAAEIAPKQPQDPPVLSGLAPGVRMELIDTLEQFLALKPHWDELYARDNHSGYFLSFDWMCETLQAHSGEWRVFAARLGSETQAYIGFFPVRYRLHWSTSRREFQTELQPAGRLTLSERAGFLCDPDQEDRAIAAIASKLATLPWVRLSLRYEPTGNRCSKFLMALPRERFDAKFRDYRINGGTIDNLVCPQIELPSTFDDFLSQRMSANSRQKIRRLMRNHLETGECTITFSNKESFASDSEVLLQLWDEQWNQQKGAYRAPLIFQKYKTMQAIAMRLGTLHLPILWRGDEPIAALGTIADPESGHAYFVLGGRKETTHIQNSGLLLHAASIRWAIENRFKIYDFGHGNEAYKYSFGAQDVQTYFITAERRELENGQRFDPLNLPQARSRLERFRAKGHQSDAKHAQKCIARFEQTHSNSRTIQSAPEFQND
ncbi:MAG: GNAT family N-acetyltransferase [Pseudomonadota bacterium]